MGEVEIDPMVLYIMMILVFLAFCPPIVCKVKQVLASNRVATEDPEDLEIGTGGTAS